MTFNEENNNGIHFNQSAENSTEGGIHFNSSVVLTGDKEVLSAISGEITIQNLLNYVRENKGSDLHIGVNQIPKIRLNGEIYTIPGTEALSEEQVIGFIKATMSPENWEIYQTKKDLDFSYVNDNNQHHRCNALMSLSGYKAVYRIIADQISSFEDLGLPDGVRKIKDMQKGLVLITGSSGSGKSTTLATLLDLINSSKKAHIISMEDPVEFAHQSKESLVNQREIKTNTKSFDVALRSALREDPDVIMIGELRDLETISLALTAAETGHLVFATLHTASATQTISRIIDVFPSGKKRQATVMLAESLQCVISQVLCKKNGSAGRIAAFEVLFATDGVRSLIREDKIFQIPSAIAIGMADDMQSLDQNLTKLVQAGKITPEEAKKHAQNPAEMNF